VSRRIRKGPSRSSRIRSDEASSAPVDDQEDAAEALQSVLPGDGDDELFGPAPLDATGPHGHATYAGRHTDARGVVAQSIFPAAGIPNLDLLPADIFDDAGYLRLNPDVRDAVESGHIESGYAHYVAHGHAEGRPLPDIPRELRNAMVVSPATAQIETLTVQARCSVEALLIAQGGGLMIVGWIDDVNRPMTCIRIIAPGWRVVIDVSRLMRVRRTDVEQALGTRTQRPYGFFGFVQFDRGGAATGLLRVELWQSGGYCTGLECAANMVESIDLRDTSLSYIASASFFGNTDIERIGCMEQGLGGEFVRFNRAITKRIVANPYVERFGSRRRSPRGTIIVCLYGKPEFYFLQNCLFGGLPGIGDYEFVYVSNSPEMAEVLLREAQSSSHIYGLSNSVMILSGNAGFGGANNVAAQIADSDRLLVVNPDVFPRDRDWASKHTELLAGADPATTRIFGAPLYYDDGSLMHGGMYFEIDSGLTLTSGAPSAQRVCRVEHYGKGAPSDTLQFTRARPVPAVTGAFISIERSWFEKLGGFTEDFVFGHYEDADLCLKSLDKGVPAWLQDIRMWHLEGKGSSRKLHHEGGSAVNRWLFSKNWMGTIEAGLKGPFPEHALLQTGTVDRDPHIAEAELSADTPIRATAVYPIKPLTMAQSNIGRSRRNSR
jgi:GT2 family glycosyltransferase